MLPSRQSQERIPPAAGVWLGRAAPCRETPGGASFSSRTCWLAGWLLVRREQAGSRAPQSERVSGRASRPQTAGAGFPSPAGCPGFPLEWAALTGLGGGDLGGAGRRWRLGFARERPLRLGAPPSSGEKEARGRAGETRRLRRLYFHTSFGSGTRPRLGRRTCCARRGGGGESLTERAPSRFLWLGHWRPNKVLVGVGWVGGSGGRRGGKAGGSGATGGAGEPMRRAAEVGLPRGHSGWEGRSGPASA